MLLDSAFHLKVEHERRARFYHLIHQEESSPPSMSPPFDGTPGDEALPSPHPRTAEPRQCPTRGLAGTQRSPAHAARSSPAAEGVPGHRAVAQPKVPLLRLGSSALWERVSRRSPLRSAERELRLFGRESGE